MFDERKIAQVAAYFLHKSGGRLYHLMLLKLMYIADRESLREYGSPISEDRMVAMPYGPVLSRTLNFMNGNVRSSADGGWEDWIADKKDHQVALRKEVEPDQLLKLSEADIEVMDRVWEKYGHIDRFDLSELTHREFGEWKDPNGSSLPISYDDVLKAMGVSPDIAKSISSEIEERQRIDNIFASL